MTDIEKEYQKLPEEAKEAWRLNLGFWSLLIWIAPAVYGFRYILNDASLWLFVSTTVTAIILTVILLVVVPHVRWRQWSYRIDENEIDLEHGIFIIRRTLVPINRVQHVDTRQGPVLRSHDLADVVISTAATEHKIPALSEEVADKARSEISSFARKAKEDV